ncbi:MAG: general stress protein [Candidatus Sulfotelmatobacter sp.]
MAGKNTAVFGIYQTQADVEYAVDALRAEGFRNTDVSVLFPDSKGTKDFAVEKNTKAPEGTAAGATTGGVLGRYWDSWRVSERLPSPESVRSSLPARSWLLLPA